MCGDLICDLLCLEFLNKSLCVCMIFVDCYVTHIQLIIFPEVRIKDSFSVFFVFWWLILLVGSSYLGGL